MLYTVFIKERNISATHEHFTSLAGMCRYAHRLANAASEVGKFLTFSGTGEDEPAADEVVATMLIGNEIVLPTSAGGTWGFYDQWVKEQSDARDS